MGNLVLRNGVRILGSLPSGAGDNVLTRDGTTYEVGTVPAVDLSSYLSNSLASTRILVGNGSNIATAVEMTGNVIIDNTGVTTIVANTIVNSQVSNTAGIVYSKLNLTNSIVNADIASAASIARTKIANGTANRILINNGSGVFSDASAITPGFALISDVNGIPTHSGVSSTVLSYLDATSSVQTQLNNRAVVNLTTPANGDILFYSGGVFVNRPIAADGQVLTLSGGVPVWGAPTANGLPIGGTANQYLRKIDGTNYNAAWDTLTLTKITDITALATDVNLLQGLAAAGLTTIELGYVNGVSSPIQTQLDNKLSATLPLNNIFIGNLSNIAVPLAAGINGYVLTSVSGVPTWQPVSAGTPPGSDTQVIFNDGGSFGADAGITYNKTANTLATLLRPAAGTTAANTAPIKLISGTAMTTPEDGALEYHTSHLYFTIGSTRFQLDQQISGLTTNRIPYATSTVTLGDSANFTWDNTNSCITLDGARIFARASNNIFFGDNTGNFTLTGNQNTVIGATAGNALTSGTDNTLIGNAAGNDITTGINNVIVGAAAALLGTNVSSCVAVGAGALALVTGNSNIAIGTNSGDNITSGTNNIVIGTNIDAQSATNNGQLSIQNIIFGTGNTATGTSISSGNIGIAVVAPSARLHLAAGTATASTAPLKLTSGTNLTTPEAGAIEFDGTNYFVTSSTTRYTVAKTLTNTATLNFGSTLGQAFTDLTITVTGAVSGDVVSIGVPAGSVPAGTCSFFGFVSAADTVTIRFVNSDVGLLDPASGTFRATVFKY